MKRLLLASLVIVACGESWRAGALQNEARFTMPFDALRWRSRRLVIARSSTSRFRSATRRAASDAVVRIRKMKAELAGQDTSPPDLIPRLSETGPPFATVAEVITQTVDMKQVPLYFLACN